MDNQILQKAETRPFAVTAVEILEKTDNRLDKAERWTQKTLFCARWHYGDVLKCRDLVANHLVGVLSKQLVYFA